AADPDTPQLPRLQSVVLSPKAGSDEAARNVKLPLGTFSYGTATTPDGSGGRKLQYRATATPVTMPSPISGEPLGKSIAQGNRGWDTLTALVDLNGDGRPDFLNRYKVPGDDAWHTFSAENDPALTVPGAPAV